MRMQLSQTNGPSRVRPSALPGYVTTSDGRQNMAHADQQQDRADDDDGTLDALVVGPVAHETGNKPIQLGPPVIGSQCDNVVPAFQCGVELVAEQHRKE